MKKYNISIERADVTKPSEKWYEVMNKENPIEAFVDVLNGEPADGGNSADETRELLLEFKALVERRTIEECVGVVGAQIPKVGDTMRISGEIDGMTSTQIALKTWIDCSNTLLSTLRGLIKEN